MKNIVVFFKVVIAIVTFVIAGFLQAAILRADLQYVYLGKSLVTWFILWILCYNGFVRTVFVTLGLYRI